MSGLRWTLFAVTAMLAAGFLALLVLADNFRRSFGASRNGPLVAVLPLVVMGIFLASLLFPGQRVLLHAAAVVAVALVAACLWVMRESVFVGFMGLIYAGLWALWYWNTAWARPPAVPVP